MSFSNPKQNNSNNSNSFLQINNIHLVSQSDWDFRDRFVGMTSSLDRLNEVMNKFEFSIHSQMTKLEKDIHLFESSLNSIDIHLQQRSHQKTLKQHHHNHDTSNRHSLG